MSWEILTILIGGVATLAIYSFLVKENSFYRFFEHLYIGIAAGYGPVVGMRDFFWPKILAPMLGFDIDVYPDGTFSKEYNGLILLYLPPMLFGLLYYTIFFKRLSWMVKLVIGFSLGAGGALAFKGFFAGVTPQIMKSFKPLYVLEGGVVNYWESFNNIFFIATLLLVMYYFFFTFRVETTAGKKSITVGRWLMMICFGAFFGSTVMARMALMVERLQFLINDWFNTVRDLVF